MSNPLFNMMNKSNMQGGPMQMMQQFMEFKKSFKGNPKEEVEKLLTSGKINQQQLNQIQSMASQFEAMLKNSK